MVSQVCLCHVLFGRTEEVNIFHIATFRCWNVLIDNIIDVSIQAVEHGVGNMKKTNTNKTLDMMLLTLLMNKYDDNVSIKDKISLSLNMF